MHKDGIELAGKLSPERIVRVDFERPKLDFIERLERIEDLSSTISDALDALGHSGVVPASVLSSCIPGSRIIGPAVTVKNRAIDIPMVKEAKMGTSRMAEIEGHNLAKPGDVLVIEGVAGISNMGGIMATIGKRQGEVGAVIDGGFRDIERARRLQYPVWSRGATPITGKWRIETLEINGRIECAGITVRPGDLVVADETGVCFVPFQLLPAVVDLVEEIGAMEDALLSHVEAELPIPRWMEKRAEYYRNKATKSTVRSD